MNGKIAGSRPETVIKWSTVLAVSLVAIVAAWISYNHTVSVVTAHGERGIVGRVYAGTIDGLIYSGSMVLLDCARRSIARPRLAYAMLGSGITATLYVNVISGLMYLVRQSAIQAVATDDALSAATDPQPVCTPDATAPPESALQSATGPTQAVAEVPQPSVPEPVAVAEKQPAHLKHADKVFADHIVSGTLPSLRTVMDACSVGQPRAREILTYIDEKHGQLTTVNGGESL